MSENLIFKIPAIRIKQKEDKGLAVYFGKIKAKDFATRTSERFEIDTFKRIDRKDQGYQREISDSAVDKIKNFLLAESPNPVLPTALLANSRVELDFKEIDSSGLGYLEVTNKLYIIDGQHRFRAWEGLMGDPILAEKWGDFEMPIVILSGFEYPREVEQFFVINSRQRRIKTDLAQRILSEFARHEETKTLIRPKDEWIKYALVIADALNEQKDNIWKGKIIIEGDSKDLKKEKIISQNSFLMSLKPFFVGSEPLFDIPKRNKPDECVDFLIEFWDFIAKAYPLPAKYYHDYSLLKTVGVFAFHLLLNNIAKQNGGLANKAKVFAIAKDVILKASNDKEGNYKSDFWLSKVPKSVREKGRYAGGYSSGAGHTRLAAGISFNSVV